MNKILLSLFLIFSAPVFGADSSFKVVPTKTWTFLCGDATATSCVFQNKYSGRMYYTLQDSATPPTIVAGQAKYLKSGDTLKTLGFIYVYIESVEPVTIPFTEQ